MIAANRRYVCLLLATVFCANACADTITVGSVTTGSSNPFFGGLRHQQRYGSELFSGVIEIEEISFFQFAGSEIDATTYTLSLSTISSGTLSTTFADNLGSDNAVFTSVSRSQGNFSAGAPITFSATTNFTYDSSAGDLLLDIVKNSNPSGGSFGGDLSAQFDGVSTSFEQVFSNNSTVTGSRTSGGLVTQFAFQTASTSAVPEPGHVVFLTMALAGWGMARRKRSQRAVLHSSSATLQ